MAPHSRRDGNGNSHPTLSTSTVAHDYPDRRRAACGAHPPAVFGVHNLGCLRFGQSGLLIFEAAARSVPGHENTLATRLEPLSFAVVPNVSLGAAAAARLAAAILLAIQTVFAGSAIPVAAGRFARALVPARAQREATAGFDLERRTVARQHALGQLVADAVSERGDAGVFVDAVLGAEAQRVLAI